MILKHFRQGTLENICWVAFGVICIKKIGNHHYRACKAKVVISFHVGTMPPLYGTSTLTIFLTDVDTNVSHLTSSGAF